MYLLLPGQPSLGGSLRATEINKLHQSLRHQLLALLILQHLGQEQSGQTVRARTEMLDTKYCPDQI